MADKPKPCLLLLPRELDVKLDAIVLHERLRDGRVRVTRSSIVERLLREYALPGWTETAADESHLAA